MKYNILVVEDDIQIAKSIEIYLERSNYKVYIASNGIEALKLLNSIDVALIISDIMMPIMDGITFTLKVRETLDVPIILLSAKSEDIDKITGLNIGADDYITKPFVPMELVARVNSQIRRYERFIDLADKKESLVNLIQIGGLELNIDTKEFRVDGKLVKLTATELRMLELFMKNPGHVYSTDQIYEIIWNEKAVNSETIMVHIRNIREKIEIDSKNPRYIKVVWGLGYKIEVQ
ncbi:MAG: response regulator transcription factor [Erysipelotrichaceae bacterium]